MILLWVVAAAEEEEEEAMMIDLQSVGTPFRIVNVRI
jgi:hypothetical protein